MWNNNKSLFYIETLAKKIFFPNDDSLFLLLQDCNGCLGCSRKAKEGIQKEGRDIPRRVTSTVGEEIERKHNIKIRKNFLEQRSSDDGCNPIVITHAHMLFIQHLIISRQMSHLRASTIPFQILPKTLKHSLGSFTTVKIQHAWTQ